MRILTTEERKKLLKLAQTASPEPDPPALSPIERVERSGRLPLSYAQQRLWFLEQMGGLGSTYHVLGRLHLRGELDREALVRALDRLVERHEALRTTFSAQSGEPEQRIGPETSRFALVEHDLVGEGREALERLMAEEATAPFDLERGPLIRGRLVRLAEDRHLLLFTMHHIVSDAWSLRVLTDELGLLYAAFREGRPDPLPPLPIQYADYAVWQRRWVEGEVLEAQASYWTKTLAGAPALLELPTDHPRPHLQDYAGASVSMVLDEPLAAGLRALGRRRGTTLFMTLLAGWAVVLGRLSGQEEVVIGTPTANRGRREIEGLIGFFVNTLALRVDLSERPTVAEVLERVKTRALEAQDNQDVPFEQVVERVNPVRTLAYAPLFQVMFDWQGAPWGSMELPGLERGRATGAEPGPVPGAGRSPATFDLTLSLRESGARIGGSLTYATSLFERATALRHLAYLRRVLEAMAADDLRAVDALPLLPEAERRLVVEEWNRTEAALPGESCLHEFFEAQVARTPDATAVIFAGETLTYAELDRRANRLAHHLRGLGIGPEDRVALCMERTPELMVAFFGILKAGAAYVPLEPTHPADRLAYVLEDSGARLLLSQSWLAEGLPQARPETLWIDRMAEALAAEPAERPESGARPENLAYVYYTSGSTGRPKGVLMHHEGPVNYFAWARGEYLSAGGQGAPVFSSMAVDLTLANFVPLFAGQPVELLAEGPGVEALAEALRRRPGYAMIKITPTHLSLLNQVLAPEDAARAAATLVIGADNLMAEPTLFWRGHAPGVRLLNEYGPTETVVGCSLYEIPANRHVEGRIPFGRPIQNLTHYVLDARMQPVPVGVAGELYIGGVGVGRGYLGRPGLTAEKFVPDPFSARPGARFYRTGDRARWLPDGNLEFLGRIDFQVKVRGYRIELGEVEERLKDHPGVRHAVVLAREDAPGDTRLVAYWVGEAADVESLRAHLGERLPAYMVPAAYVRLEQLPLGRTGKLDRRALPAPEGDAFARSGYEAPVGETEEALAEIWAEVLGVERVGRWDHFFELGGHSLLAVQVISRVRQVLAVEAELGQVFTRPVLADFARELEAAARAELPPIDSVDREGRLPLSFAQQRLWFLEQLGNLGSTYHVPGRLRLRGELDRAALVRALDGIVARHEVLRTVFAQVNGVPEQRIAPSDIGFHLVEHDLIGEPNAQAEFERVLAEEAGAPFDLERGPLIRGRLIRLAADDHMLLVTMHHIVSDAWSSGVLTRELSALYGAFGRGEPDPLPPLPVQYADYAAWQRRWVEGEVLQAQADYWTRTLSGAPELLELPTDHPRPARQDFAGATAGLVLGEELTAGLKALSRRHGTTLFMTVLAGWATLLSRLSGQEDVVVGTPSANRGRREIEGLIGFFVNTLALRVELSGAPAVAEVLARVKARALEAQANQDIPFEQVVELVQPARSLAHTPLFQVMLAWQNAPREGLALPGLRLAPAGAASPHVTAKFDLMLSLGEAGGRIGGGVEYATALFERATVERWLGYLRRVLEAFAADDALGVDRLPMLPEAERALVLEEFNDTLRAYPREACVHELFEAQAARTPGAVAVVFEGERVSYTELNARANRLAHHLRSLGVAPDTRVGICVVRSVEMVVGLLGILKAGGAYVPLDASYPVDRLRFMLEDSAPAVLLTHPPLAATVAELSAGSTVPVLDLTSDDGSAERPETNPGCEGLGSRNLAHVLFTSGSTGRPKGVMLEHGSLVNRLAWMQDRYGMEPGEALLQKTPFSFDVSFWEFFWPLMVGARLVMARPGGHRDPAYLVETIRREGITVAHFVPSMLQLFLEHPDAGQCTGLLRVPVSGEAISAALARQFHQRLPGVSLSNQYGPTESGEVTEWECDPDAERVSIGRAIHNSTVYVLDRTGGPMPVGVAGELFIGGVAVARGYLGWPRLTAERFVPDPFGGAGARMYRTGDLCRWLVDGTLEYLGRTDFQVKVRGFRVELGEIEARLVSHPGVREAVVLALEDGAGGKRLVAYFVGEALESEALRAHLSEQLPEYMVPAAFVRLERLPLNPNGKLDRRALPAPEADAFATRGYEAPLGETEAALAEIWADVLRVERVGRWDDFFALGGHSLLAVQVISRVRQVLGVEVALGELFTRPVLGDFARALETAARSELPPIECAPREGPVPLSFAQQRLWFLEQLGGLDSAYHIHSRLRLRGELDRTALVGALDGIVARHEALRTTFAQVDGVPEQRIAPAEASGFHLVEHDLSGRADAAAELGRLMFEEANAPFNLERGPLIRGRLIRRAPDDHVLLLTMHHIVSDGWSMGVFTRELSALYGAFRGGEPDPLPPLPIQYADYAAWQRQWVGGEVLRQQADYWKAALAGAPALLELPTDHSRPARQGHASGVAGVDLGEELTAGLKALGQRRGTTLFMTLLAGWAAVLARLSGEEEVVIGTPTANRGRAEIEGLIGFFVNTLALRVDLSGSPTVAELLEQVRVRSLGAQQNQDIPFEQVVELVQPVRSMAHSPLFQVMFAWQNASEGRMELPGLRLGGVGSTSQPTSKFDLSLSLGEAGGRIGGSITYATALFEQATVERHLAYLRRVLEAFVADDLQGVDALPLLPEAERRLVVEEWNATEAAYPSERCIHELVEAQAARAPDAVAVVFEGGELTYAELNAHANRLAHHLRDLGVGPDARVAICVERGPAMMVGLLAILKAGGGYVPLDPSYPAERLRYMLHDSAPAAVLTQGSLEGVEALFAGVDVPVVDLEGAEWARCPATDPEHAGLTPGHLAYVIYTSGSTGMPKGVMIEHRSLANHTAWQTAAFEIGAGDTVLQRTSISFDASVWELWTTLATGARLLLLPPAAAKDPGAIARVIEEGGVTVVQFVPTLLQAVLAALPKGGSLPCRIVFCGGEPLTEALVAEARARGVGEVVNLYGPTEATIDSTAYRCGDENRAPAIGAPVSNVRVYVLDGAGEPVPVGVAGELYVGGVGVARGYLGRAGLTAERFVPDWFSPAAGARMYRTSDLGRWRADGTIEFLGRTDFQVKIRGFRVELGEIEARLRGHASVREAIVVAREDRPGDQRLVAYIVGSGSVGADALRGYLAERLPEHMVPAAYVRLEALPLTPSGKVDRKALPAPEGDAFATRGYEAPVGETEQALAEVWAELLGVERVGRRDHFFELGGHSLLAVQVIARLRRRGLHAEVRALFTAPTLVALAAEVGGESREVEVPANGIAVGCDAITPEMLPLVCLEQAEIDEIVAGVPGGAANVQDIYSLAPLQEGIFFHHLVAQEGDPYLLAFLYSFESREGLDRYLGALQAVIDRHDVLRTAVVWEGLREPVQVVWRQAPLEVEEVELDPARGDAAKELYARFDPRYHRLDVREAPIMRACIAHDGAVDRWLLLLLRHHLITDHTTGEVLEGEIEAHLSGRADALPEPLPFRNYVAQARLGVSQEEHREFFTELLGDVEEPTAPFGLLDVRGEGAGVEEARLPVEGRLAGRLRERARSLGVSAATLCHVAWAQVLSRVSGRDDVVFGTVLLGRMQGGEGSDRVMGPFINTLPVRIRVGKVGAEASVRQTHALLAKLLRHEHASLALAQRCSALEAPAPLFTALLNYRHSGRKTRSDAAAARTALDGMRGIRGEERTNYPLMLSVDDLGEGFWLTAQVGAQVEARRVCALMHTALEGLVEALEGAPERAVGSIDVLPASERAQVVEEWNRTEAEYPGESCIHRLFEEQVARTPDAVAVVFEGERLTYAELNGRANRLAHHLRSLGVGPDVRVGICAERSPALVVGLFGVLKAGGAYVPLDPGYPAERLAFMLDDSAPAVVLTQKAVRDRVENTDVPVLELDAEAPAWTSQSATNPAVEGLRSDHLAYVIYTSGSTGWPKGVAIAHRNTVNLLSWAGSAFEHADLERTLFSTSLNFDLAVFELFTPLMRGATACLVEDAVALLHSPVDVTLVNTVPSAIRALLDGGGLPSSVRTVNLAGEPLKESLVERIFAETGVERVCNLYGPSETTTYSTGVEMRRSEGFAPHIGTPLQNTRVYLLDQAGEPVPVGVAGELYIGGAGVARGYLGRAALTAERFVADAYGGEPGARLYRTGDFARWLPDGAIEFLGRVDHQMKVRGYRIELGEIEARLAEHVGVREAVLLAREDVPGEKRLVAYVVGEETAGADVLRAHLSRVLPAYMVPAAYVRLEQLPLTPNGKVDRKALPAPEGDAYGARGYEAPVGETEQALAEIWADVLRVERVGRHDHFFKLGGHSLLAVQVVSRVRQVLGVELDLGHIFSHPTVESLSARVRGPERVVQNDRAIAIHPAGSKLPLFLVHEGTGTTAYAHVLSSHLDGEIPVYALPPQPPSEPPLHTIEGMATRLVRMIREVQSSGPYRVAGWSLGGLLSYEIASQLVGQGEIVEFVGILDGLSSIGPQDVVLNVRRVAGTTGDWRLENDEEMCALREYRPQPIPAPVHLFVARQSAGPDPLSGWGVLLPEWQLQVTFVPGTHRSMMSTPNVETLGREFSRQINHARERVGRL